MISRFRSVPISILGSELYRAMHFIHSMRLSERIRMGIVRPHEGGLLVIVWVIVGMPVYRRILEIKLCGLDVPLRPRDNVTEGQ